MKNNHKKPDLDQIHYLKMRWEQAFRDLLDEIYWSGYAERLFENEPEQYAREYWHFIVLYDGEPPFDWIHVGGLSIH